MSSLHQKRQIAVLGGAVLLCALSAIGNIDSRSATAAPIQTGGVSAYISAPFVQGPPAAFGASIETFDGLTTGACNLATLNTSTSLGTFSGGCNSWNGADSSTPWGGAQTTSDTPTVGSQGAPSPSRFISPVQAGGLTLTLATPAKYFGFWWSAGSPGDTVTIYGSDLNTPIATYTLQTINTLLGGPNPPTTPSAYSSLGTVTSIGGTEYNKSRYWGRPWNYPNMTPTALWSTDVNQNIYLHAYINTFAAGSTAITKVTFSTQSFEFDNLAVTSTPQSPPSSFVFLESIVGKSVEFRANGGTGSMMAQNSDASTTLTPNTFTRAGYTFAGWHTTSSGTGGTSYTDEDAYGFTSDTVLFAQWTANTLAVTYDTQGGSSINAGSTTTAGNLTDPGIPTRNGHTFSGWFTEATGGTALAFPHTHGRTSNFTLFAQWTAVVAQKPSTIASTPLAPSTTSTTTLPPPTTTVARAMVAVQSLPATGANTWLPTAFGLLVATVGLSLLRRPRRCRQVDY